MNNRFVKISIVLVVVLIAGFLLEVSYSDNMNIKKVISALEKREQKQNFASSLNSTKFKTLPTIVKKYLRKGILKTDKYSVAKIKLTGITKNETEKDWVKKTAEKTYSLVTPEFIEVSETSVFNVLWEKGIRQFVNGIASCKVKLLSSISKENLYGNQLNRSYLTLYLIESVFAPSILLPSMNVKWRGITNNSAEATIWYKNLQSKVIFRFNDKGEVTRITSNDFFIPNEIDYKRVGITYSFANYKNVNSYYIPTFFEVEINLPGKNFTTGRFQISEINYR